MSYTIFEIKEHIGVIEPRGEGWNLELNIVAWDKRPAKFDIRSWDPDYERMSRGITLDESDMTLFAESYTNWRKEHSLSDLKDASARELSKRVESTNIDVSFVIRGHIVDLSEQEVNIVSWNGDEPKVDIRKWTDDGLAYRGVTFTEDEADTIAKLFLEWKKK